VVLCNHNPNIAIFCLFVLVQVDIKKLNNSKGLYIYIYIYTLHGFYRNKFVGHYGFPICTKYITLIIVSIMYNQMVSDKVILYILIASVA